MGEVDSMYKVVCYADERVELLFWQNAELTYRKTHSTKCFPEKLLRSNIK